MAKLKFLDGSTVTDEYLKKLQGMLDGALDAEDEFSLDELEEHANSSKEGE